MDSVASRPSIKEMIDLEIRRLAHSHCAFVKWLAVCLTSSSHVASKEGAKQKHETVLLCSLGRQLGSGGGRGLPKEGVCHPSFVHVILSSIGW